ncbi:uncharacterized protein BDZ99DRAFT_571301 [Mytilinidion resinicola]|uniref:Protein kinase domain-containing protein n=1 Tax=Mytilinidion resinicola TaxID=574789 RepID=A0A6A6YLT5_9PEZI|nr:uncharacterized protein BDZ99DRAFT_571301 [Mytilinidion resinicola]KAF2809498.1 hypothetical protein BDZ99DRAFT_571301 [Mytilinidion resinicola]
MTQERDDAASSFAGAKINFSVGSFDSTGEKCGGLGCHRGEADRVLPERIKELGARLSSVPSNVPTNNIHAILTSYYDSVVSTSSSDELDLLDLLAVVQHWRVNILPVQWNEDEDIGSGGTAGITQGVNARDSSSSTQLDFAFKRVHREHLEGNDERADLQTLFSEVLVLGHPVIRHHPNILELEGICFEDVNNNAWPVLIFKKASHQDMRNFMIIRSQEYMGASERLKLCGDIANAILLMHACNVIHGDIKPENVLIFDDGGENFTAKVSDFGYSSLRTSNEGQINLPESWPWTAPEILIENTTTFACAKSADIFSFGMLCVWILFVGSTSTQAMETKRPQETNASLDYILSGLKKDSQLLDYAKTQIDQMSGISDDRKASLYQFFASSLSKNVDERDLNEKVVKSAFGCDCATDVLMSQFGQSATPPGKPLFQLTSSYRQFKNSRPSLKECVVSCFKNRAGNSIDDTIRNISAFQLAFCYNVGFGVPSDPVESTSWLRRCDKGVQDLEDMLRMTNDDESRRYGNVKVHASMFGDGGEKSRNKGKGKLVTGKENTVEEHASLQHGPDASAMGTAVGWIFSNFGVKNTKEIKFLDVTNAGYEDNGRAELLKRCREEFRWDKPDSEYETVTIEVAFHEDDVGKNRPVDGGIADDTLQNQEYEEKAQLERVETKIKVLGEDHPDALESMETLGRLYWNNENRWAEAKQLVIRVMEILIGTLGVNHPDTLEAMERAATMHMFFERWEEEEDLRLRIMEIRLRLFGIRNGNTLDCLECLVRLFLKTQRLTEAEELQEQVVEARMVAPGVTDAKGLKSMELMVEILMADEKWEKAERYQQWIVHARRHTVGDKNVDTLESIEVLVAIYVLRGQRYKEAEELQDLAASAYAQIHGSDHPATLMSQEKLASIYALDQQYEKAEDIYRQIVDVRTRRSGCIEKDDLQAMQFLALLYKMQQRNSDLEDIQRMIVEARKHNFGQEDSSTLAAKNDLASTCMRLQQWDIAQTLYEDVLESRKKILGSSNEETLKSMNDLAMACNAAGSFEKAEVLLSDVLEKARESVGSKHSITARAVYNLAETYKYLGNWEKAEELLSTERSAAGHLGFIDDANDLDDEYFKTCRTLEDLNEVIPVLEEGAMTIPEGHPARAMKLHELSELYQRKFHAYYEPADLDTAQNWAEQAVDAAFGNNAFQSLLLKALGKIWWEKFKMTSQEEHMNRAVDEAEKAVYIAENTNPNRAILLANLAKMLVRRYERTRDEDDLDAAFVWAEQANISTAESHPESHPDRAITSHRLSNTYWHRFNSLGNLDDLKEAVKYEEEALETLRDNDCKRPLRLYSFAKMLKTRYERTEDIEHLEQSLIWYEQAVESVPRTGKEAFTRCVWLGDLIRLFEKRFELTGNLDDLDQSIDRANEAADIASDDTLELPLGSILTNLAGQYYQRFTCTPDADLKDFENAVQLADRAVEATPEDHKDWAYALHNQQFLYDSYNQLVSAVVAAMGQDQGEDEENEDEEGGNGERENGERENEG